MIRAAFVLAYLAAMAFAVISVDAGSDLEGWGVLIWAIASLALGIGTGYLSLALLAFLAIPFAVPFDYPSDAQLHDPLPTWFGVMYLSLCSAGLVLLAAVAGRIVEQLRKRRPSV